jgi:NTP pyrophosphatase (non-canonical NTP hydrolase)
MQADYDFNKTNGIRESIENMSKFNQIEILRILTRHKEVIINENKYGIHINLSDLRNEILDELLVYVSYVTAQEIELNNIEKQKESYKNTYFLKDNKDNFANINSLTNSKYVS